MNRATMEAYREKLLALGRRLNQEISDLDREALQATGGEASGGLSDVPVHPGDLSSRQVEEDLTLGLVDNEERLRDEVNAALVRIERGTFGRCERCHAPLAEARLRAVPYARCCVPCARTREQAGTAE